MIYMNFVVLQRERGHARRGKRIFHPGEKPKKNYPENSFFLKKFGPKYLSRHNRATTDPIIHLVQVRVLRILNGVRLER